MASSNRIITDIAQAAVKAAQAKDCTEKLLQDFAVLAEMFQTAPGLAEALSDSSVPLDARYSALKKAGHELHEYSINAVALLMQDNKLSRFQDFKEQMETAAREISKHFECTALTAIPMPAEEKRKLKSALEKHLGGTISLNCQVDPNVIGGLSVSCGDWRYVSTIQSKLQQLSKHLTTNS